MQMLMEPPTRKKGKGENTARGRAFSSWENWQRSQHPTYEKEKEIRVSSISKKTGAAPNRGDHE